MAAPKRNRDFEKARKIMAKWIKDGCPPLIGGPRAEQVKWAREILDRVR